MTDRCYSISAVKRSIDLFFMISFLLLVSSGVHAQSDLDQIFLDPPDEAKPRTYWIWAHGNFDYTRIKEELTTLKEMGLGGADIFDMGIGDPFDIIPPGNEFMGREMLDGIAFSLEEAKKLGLSMGLSVSCGWNAGGPWTPPDEQIMRLLFWRDTVSGPTTLQTIGFPEVPTTFQKPYGQFELYPQIDDDGFPEFYQNVSVMAYPLRPDGMLKDSSEVLNFDVGSIDGNTIQIDLPEGQWVLARAVVTPLGQRMWVQGDKSKGWIMDHYASKATKRQFELITDRLHKRVGDLGSTALERLYLASFEAEDYIIWSPELQETFQQQHGYSMTPYMAIFAGQQIVDSTFSARFLHDYRSTVSEMFIHNHYRQARDICHRHGIQLASESGGPGPPLHYVPTEDLKALGSVDIMRGEFWNRKPRHFDANGNDLIQVVKNIGSAAHIYGRKIVEMEAFTSFKHWQESPLTLKKLADRAFCEGMTRAVYHTMTHSPKEGGSPGWSYQAGTHISPKMTWWSMSKPFHSYLARSSALLQQGQYVADVAYYYGEQIPNFASGTKFIRKSLGAGYSYDDLNKEVLLQSTVDSAGRLVLPSGMSYELLVLPEDPMMSLTVLKKIDELLSQGATILGPPPSTVLGLANYEEGEMLLKKMVEKIWGKNRGRFTKNYDEGTLYQGYNEKEILQGKGIGPDLTYHDSEQINLDFIHRSTDAEEIYFIRNEDSTKIQTEVTFRVSEKRPFHYNAVQGTVEPIAWYFQDDHNTTVPLSFDPYGSLFIVFKKKMAKERHITNITDQNYPSRPVQPFMVSQETDESFTFTFNDSSNYLLKYSDGATSVVSPKSRNHTLTVHGPWRITFSHGWGFDPIQQFDTLVDWCDHENTELSKYSGIATCKSSFTLDKDYMRTNSSYFLDLGKVGEVATIYLNGSEIATKVFAPFSFDITKHVRAGENDLVIDVANTWSNQLIGEVDIPYNEQRTRSNVGARDGYDRPWRAYKPRQSGLLGPVQVLIYENIQLD
ncbi:MAG: hypothetical protein HKN87_01530 [Saprospiraceae bacterium]|nr:hypothetical protein [Saprospiraceae bacterium]